MNIYETELKLNNKIEISENMFNITNKRNK